MVEKNSQYSPLREIIAQYQLTANKSLGQNYLLDKNITDKITKSAGSLKDKVVIEIGSGPGGLTRSILDSDAQRLIAIEIDKRFQPVLEDLKETHCARFDYFLMNGLDFDYSQFEANSVQIFSNLPFHSGNKFLIQWLSSPQWPPYWSKLTLLFQQEVAQRIVAKPNTKPYGRLSVFSQIRSNPKIVMSIPASAFTPVPKVHSSLVQFTPKDTPPDTKHCEMVDKIIRLVFQKRRKMLRTSLKPLSNAIEFTLAQTGIDPQHRPEQLSVDDYLRLSSQLLGNIRNNNWDKLN